jgi:hypothetical protein
MSKHFAIHRAGRKIRSWSQVSQVNGHNAREKQPWNADTENTPLNQVLIGTGNLEHDMKCIMAQAGLDPSKKRKNGVLAMEFLYTASPRFFTDWKGERNEKRTSEWRDAALAHVKETFGEHRIATATLHLDEKTPHMHVCVVPVHNYTRAIWPRRSKDPRKQSSPRAPQAVTTLSAFAVFGSREQFRARQTAYAAAMKPLGLSRGLSGSKRKHRSMKAFYASEVSSRRDYYTARIKLVKFARELEDVSLGLMTLAANAGLPGQTPQSVSEYAKKILDVLAGADDASVFEEESEYELSDTLIPDLS